MPPQYPDPTVLANQLQALNQPEFTIEQNQLARQLQAQGAKDQTIYGGGFGQSYGQSMADLVAKQGQTISGALNTAEQNNLDRMLKQYGIDISNKQFWADLSLKAYQGDQLAQQFYTYLMTALGLTPAQIAAIISGTTPVVAYQPPGA